MVQFTYLRFPRLSDGEYQGVGGPLSSRTICAVGTAACDAKTDAMSARAC